MGGFDLLGEATSPTYSQPSSVSSQPQPTIQNHQPQQPQQPQQTHKFKAVETQEIEIWMEARK